MRSASRMTCDLGVAVFLAASETSLTTSRGARNGIWSKFMCCFCNVFVVACQMDLHERLRVLILRACLLESRCQTPRWFSFD